MAKVLQSDFKFRRSDRIGAASAEDDNQFLKECFVQTDEYEVLKDIEDIRQIVLGRTGSGKSALFERLKTELPEHVISIEPQELALTYVSNSPVIRYFSEIGVNLDPFYKLLWRHVLTVEVLRQHFASHAHDERGSLWEVLIDRFSSKSSEGKAVKEAVEYLREWGERFWVEVEFRVKEITKKMESDLTKELAGELRTSIIQGGAGRRVTEALSEEERVEVINRGQRVVSAAQVQNLSKAQNLLQSVLTDRQQYYYILIDRLDENWVEEKLRYRLIMTLLESVKELSNVPHIKVLVAVRRDLLDKVFRLLRDAGAGFQEEKYQSLYLPLHWSPKKLIEVLDRRVNALVVSRYQKRKKVTHRDLLPKKVDNAPVDEFITDRARRPRDVISLFNQCIDVAEGKTRVSVSALRKAEGAYSRHRLKALGDEWHAIYPGLLDFVDILKKRPPAFSLSRIADNEISELCLDSSIEHPSGPGVLREGARKVIGGPANTDDFKSTLLMAFYNVGLVGLKLETFEGTSWSDEAGQSVSRSEIDDQTGVVVHPTYWRALGIDARQQPDRRTV